MANILYAKPVVQALKERIEEQVADLNEKGIQPTMAIIRVGNRPDDLSYEAGILKNCQSLGITARVFETATDITMEDFLQLMNKVNGDESIHGILMFRPLPEQLDIDVIKHHIHPQKDIDCIHPMNLEGVFESNNEGFYPCTPEAVMEILKHYQIPLQGAHAVVINQSMVVGRPLAMMLLGERATVTVCHSKTRNLPGLTSQGDIVIAAVGKARMFGEEYFGQHAVVIDVGINGLEDGTICGDINFEAVKDKVQGITPVPGGVGAVTSTILLKHVVEACIRQMGINS